MGVLANVLKPAPNAEYATETREELLYNKEKLLTNGTLLSSHWAVTTVCAKTM